jgi:hypothetical protein
VLTDPAATDATLKRVIRRAMILFCEATRIEAVLKDMGGGMGYTVYEEALAALLWFRIRKWKKMSNYGLYRRKKVLVEGGDGVDEIQLEAGQQEDEKEDIKESKLHEYLAECELYSLDQVIGPALY